MPYTVRTMSYRIAMTGACPFPVPQGSQVLLRQTAEGLAARGHELHLVVYGYGCGDYDGPVPLHRARNLVPARKTAAGPSLAKPLLDAALAAAIRRVVRQHGCDLIHAHNYEALIAALASRAAPVVYHAHNALADELPFYTRFTHTARRIGGWADRVFPRRARAVIAPHARLAEYLIACGCPADRVTVVPPPADSTLLELPLAFGDAPAVLYAGNLDRYQNLPFLEAVMRRVREALPGTPFLIATHQPCAVGGVETLRADSPGSVRDAHARDVVVAVPRTSWSGYPIKLVNAMAAGKAVVACGGAAHPIIDDVNGRSVPDNDEAAFAEAVLECLRDRALRERLGRAARITAQTEHAPDRVAGLIEGAYRQALGGV